MKIKDLRREQSQSKISRIIDCNWSILFGVRLIIPIIDDPFCLYLLHTINKSKQIICLTNTKNSF